MGHDPETLDMAQCWPRDAIVESAFACAWRPERLCRGYVDLMGITSDEIRAQKAWAMVHDAAGIRPDGVAGLLGWIEAHKELLATLVYWHDRGHIDESWWEEARRLARAEGAG